MICLLLVLPTGIYYIGHDSKVQELKKAKWKSLMCYQYLLILPV